MARPEPIVIGVTLGGEDGSSFAVYPAQNGYTGELAFEIEDGFGNASSVVMSYEEVEVITATLITWLTTTGDPRPTPGPELDDLLALFEGIITPQDIVDAPVVDLTVDDDEELDSWLDDEEDDEEEDDEEEDDEEEDDEEEDDEEDGTLTDVEDEPFWPAPAPVSPYEPAAPVDDEPEVDREDEEELDEDALLEDDEVEDPQAQFEAAKVKHAEECPICAPFTGGARGIDYTSLLQGGRAA